MIDRVTTADCTLCGSCANICPTGAISYAKGYLDFFYPSIDAEKCVSCGKCDKACPVLNADVLVQDVKPSAFIGKNRDDLVRLESSSGGVFSALAEFVLAQGGYVCGAVFDSEHHVHHQVSNDRSVVRQMLGSKYAQSDMSGVSQQVRSLLREGKMVLFSGCPCQIAGLRAFLGKQYDQLILAEVICHGIPSDLMLQSYIQYREKKAGSKVKSIVFRDKAAGWHQSAVKIVFENGKIYRDRITTDAYMRGFLGATVLKESCYQCRFNRYRSGSDLILGDFWGAEAVRPELDDNKGLSAVIVNTDKGKAVLAHLEINQWEESVEVIEHYNQNLIKPTKPNPNRAAFYEYADQNGYVSAIHKFFRFPLSARMKEQVYYALRCLRSAITGRKKPMY